MEKASKSKISPENQTIYDRCLNWFKNKVLFVVLLLIILLYSGVSELIKKTKENQENLFGKDGLLKKRTIIDTFTFRKVDIPDKNQAPLLATTASRHITGNKWNHSQLPFRDTIYLSRIDTIYIDTSKFKITINKYTFRMDSLAEGQTFIDPLTNSSIAIFNILPGLTAKAILNYPNGFYTLSADTPEQIDVRPGQSWDDIIYEQKRFKMTVLDINYQKKRFSICIDETVD